MPIPFIPFENTLCQDNSAHGSFPVRFICSPGDVPYDPPPYKVDAGIVTALLI